ncbi:MAG TPA: biotin--[acetyl-CoA-carboxylase] ligase [Desulfatiglandales bacterium]|nr:biotin--[acetyl-CoA-carboxylase] ligase [Desulfatiglandales bacterium]
MYDKIRNDELQDIINKLPGSLFSRHVYCFFSIESTNVYAKELAKSGAAEGSLVIAERQTRGQGRMGRPWHSPSCSNLLFSIIFRPPFSIDRAFSLTMIAALAVVDAINKITGLSALIKWPNDVFFNNKKVAGILTEFSAKRKNIEYVVVGIGLNVNWDISNEPELKHVATSLINETGRPVSRLDLLATIFEFLEEYYELLLKGQEELVYKRWNDFSMVIGKEALINSTGKRIKAKVKRIDRNGALVIEDETGKESSVVCGDLEVLFPSLTPAQR